MKGNYEVICALKAAENKANSKPNKAKQSQFTGLWPETLSTKF
jgi:hypothetical protein